MLCLLVYRDGMQGIIAKIGADKKGDGGCLVEGDNNGCLFAEN